MPGDSTGFHASGASRRSWLLPVLLPPLVFALLYARSIDYELTWTDRHAIGGQVHAARSRQLRPQRLERESQRLRLEHHPGAAAVRPVVHRAVRVVDEIARTPRPDRQHAALDRTTEHAKPQHVPDELRKQRDHDDPHPLLRFSRPRASRT